MRFYFYATERNDGQWELHSSLSAQPAVHANREAALLAARINCRRHWELHGTPCGVRVRSEDGSWIDEHLEGEPGNLPDPPRGMLERMTAKLLRDRRRR